MMDKARPLVTEFNRAYKQHTEIKNVCTHRYYRREKTQQTEEGKSPTPEIDTNYDSLEYYQIGRRVSVPVSLVEQGRFRYVSETAGDALAEGEKSFLAERLDVLAEKNGWAKTTTDGSSVVQTGRDLVGEPDLILVPRTGRFDTVVENWEKNDNLRKFGDSRYYLGEGQEATDCWIYRFNGLDSAFMIDTEVVSVVQKRGDMAETPSEFAYDVSAESLNEDAPVSVYFGEKRYSNGDEDFGEFFDLMYRVVLSEPVAEEGGLCKVIL